MDEVTIRAEELDLHALGSFEKGLIETLKGGLHALSEEVVANGYNFVTGLRGAKELGDGGVGRRARRPDGRVERAGGRLALAGVEHTLAEGGAETRGSGRTSRRSIEAGEDQAGVWGFGTGRG